MLYKIKKRNKYKYGDLTIPILILFFILVIILRNAWVSEDAYITFRTVDNFVNGYGLTFNVGERVQGYTNPLLLFIMSLLYLLTNDVFYTSMILLSLVSIFAIGIAFLYVSESNANTILGASFLVFSKSFIDFSTSGLENPLTHLIIVFFFSVYIGRNLKLNSAKTVFLLSLLSALALINRMDTIILFIPPLIYVFYLEIKNQKINFLQLFKFTFLGFLPYFIWVGFALLYYGFPFPNTAYAKLSTGISNSELIKQGFIYFSHTLDRDPLTIVGIALGIIAVIVVRSKKYMPFILGILLYLFYIIKIGGCFMAGRFFTAPLLLSVLLFMHIRMIPKRQVNLIYLITVFFVIIGIALPFNPVLSNSEYEGYGIVSGGIADERGFYYNYTGLLRSRITEHHWVINGTKLKEEAEKASYPIVVVHGNMGLQTFYAGQKVYFVDINALTDPLLSRLPSTTPWRIGHFARTIPEGYVETLQDQNGINRIKDPNLASYYDKLSLITKGDILSWKRLKTIVWMNLKKYDHLFD